MPPDTGIVHQVNLEYLARVVFVDDDGNAYPDTLVGTDSHTTMINGLGVLGWGVGGIEAEAAMLGQPMSMLIPQVLGFKLHGELPEGATATDLVLTVTELLRKKGVVGKFVEFYGPGVSRLPLADRATIGNMSPEFGSTCAIFPIDAETLRYLAFSGRPKELIELVEAYAKEQGLWHDENAEEPTFSDTVELDLGDVVPSLAGPKRPQDRVRAARREGRLPRRRWPTSSAGTPRRRSPTATTRRSPRPSRPPTRRPTARPGHEPDPHEPASAPAVAAGTVIAEHSETAAEVTLDGETFKLDHGHVVIAAITSCTNTSNPSVMLGAGLLARNAVARGLTSQPWVKTSLAPGSKVVTEYLDRAGLTEPLEELGFNLVGYGCTTCIGNSGPLPDEISAAVNEARPRGLLGAQRQPQLRGAHQPRREDELPRLAAAGGGLRDRRHDGHRPRRRPARASTPTATRSTSRTSGPRPRRSRRPSRRPCSRTCSARATARSSTATSAGTASRCPTGDRFAWDEQSTYVRQPPYFEGLPPEPDARRGHRGRARAGHARRLA